MFNFDLFKRKWLEAIKNIKKKEQDGFKKLEIKTEETTEVDKNENNKN